MPIISERNFINPRVKNSNYIELILSKRLFSVKTNIFSKKATTKPNLKKFLNQKLNICAQNNFFPKIIISNPFSQKSFSFQFCIKS